MNTKRTSLYFDINEVIPLFYVFLVLYMPGPLALRTIIYRVSATIYFGERGWLGYSYSAFSLIALFVGIRYLFKINKNDVYIGLLVLYLTLWNFFRVVVGASNIFQYRDYSLFLSLLTGYGVYIILKKFCHIKIDDLFDLIITLNFLTQLINVFSGRQLDYGGRFAAIGSTTGSVGVMCASYIIYYLFCRRSDRKSISSFVAAIISLFLSGSRFNIMITVVFVIIFVFKLRKGIELNRNKKKNVRLVLIVGIFVLPIAANYLERTIFASLLNRTEDIIGAIFARNASYVTEDLSFNARLLSLQAGLKTIAENPFGLSTSSIDLQAHTIKHGFAFFPHSTLLSYYLLWGPPALVVFFTLLKRVRYSARNDNNIWILTLYFIVSFIVYGSPIIESKTYLWYFLMFDYIKNNINSNEQTSILEEHSYSELQEP